LIGYTLIQTLLQNSAGRDQPRNGLDHRIVGLAMLHRAVPYLIEFYRILWVVSVLFWLLLGFYAQWKIHTAYTTLGERVRKQGYTWFSFQFQLPSFSRGTPLYVEHLDSLPPDLRARYFLLRKQMLRSIWLVVVWLASLVVIGVLLALIGRYDR
jgi:hypothetical protein